jgi:hypothetical protein
MAASGGSIIFTRDRTPVQFLRPRHRIPFELILPLVHLLVRHLPSQDFDRVPNRGRIGAREERKHQHDDGEGRPAEHAHELPFLIEVNLADDGVVADVLFDGEFKIVTHATCSTTRNLALRALGFAAISVSPGIVGRRETASPGCRANRRIVCFTADLRAVKRDDRQPPALAPARRRLPTNCSNPSSSPFTQMQRLNVRVANIAATAGARRAGPRRPSAS